MKQNEIQLYFATNIGLRSTGHEGLSYILFRLEKKKTTE